METEIGEELHQLAESIQTDYPLSKYIEHIDLHVGDDTVLRSLGDRIGMRIPETEYAINYLYINLKKLLLKRPDAHQIYEILQQPMPEDSSELESYFNRLYKIV
jgi:hypothetical protein